MWRGWRGLRSDEGMWQAYDKANKVWQACVEGWPKTPTPPPLMLSVTQIFADTLVEVVSVESDSVWIHDYHLLVLPSLLRKRFNRIK